MNQALCISAFCLVVAGFLWAEEATNQAHEREGSCTSKTSLHGDGRIEQANGKIAQTIVFSLPENHSFASNRIVPLCGTTSAGLALTYSSSDPAVVQIVGTNIVIKGAGTATITASQAGNSLYFPASNVVQKIVVK